MKQANACNRTIVAYRNHGNLVIFRGRNVMLKSMSILAVGAAMLTASPAISAVVLSSSANVASVNLSVANVVAVGVTLAPVSGTAAPDYNNGAGLASINQTFHLFNT